MHWRFLLAPFWLFLLAPKWLILLGSNNIYKAEGFKATIQREHKEILEPLFKGGFAKGCLLEQAGFTTYEGTGISFSTIGMRPLENDWQMLGLLLALAEYGNSVVPGSVYVIDGCRQARRASLGYEANVALKQW